MSTTKDRTTTPETPAPATDFLVWLEAKRTASDLSWAEVSRRSGISDNGLRRIRQGEVTPRPATVTALAKALGASADDVADAEHALGTLLPFGHDKGADEPLLGIPARRGRGEATTYLTVGVTGPRATRLDRETAGRLIVFLEATARAWLLTADCPEREED